MQVNEYEILINQGSWFYMIFYYVINVLLNVHCVWGIAVNILVLLCICKLFYVS